MKFLPSGLEQPEAAKLRTAFTVLSILVAFVLFGSLMALRVGLHAWASTGRRGPAGDDPQGVVHPAAAATLQGRIERTGRDGGHAQRRGSAASTRTRRTSSRRSRSSPSRSCRCIPSTAAGGPEAAWYGRPHGRDRRPRARRSLRLEGRRPHSAAGDDLAEGDGSRLGVQDRRHLRRHGARAPTHAVLLPLRLLRRGARRSARTSSAGTSCGSPTRSEAAEVAAARSMRSSPTRRPRPRPRPRRRSCRRSRSRSATSARL